ncbi:MAG: TIGR00296 family protein [Candidatus Thermoplasmatota archaeon]
MMLSQEDGIQAVRLARTTIEQHVQHQKLEVQNLPATFSEKHGVFVTIHTYPEYQLRGCIGIPLPVKQLKHAITDAAVSATHDPRFPPLRKEELDSIVVEVTILTKPELITVSKPSEYPQHIKIGRDGLIVEQGFFAGLLLPQVPVEQGWDTEEFLSQTCMKAGLLPDAWFDKDIRISKFTGQIFAEQTPKGTIQEKKLDGSHN